MPYCIQESHDIKEMISYYPNSLGKALFHGQTTLSNHGDGPRTSLRHEDHNSLRQTFEESSVYSSSTEINREEELSQLLDVTALHSQRNNFLETSQSFAQSVTVVPTTRDGKYSVYTGSRSQSCRRHGAESTDHVRESFLDSLKYDHNISNPELRRQRNENESDKNMTKNIRASKDEKEEMESHGVAHLEDCQCGRYHCHKFKTQTTNTKKFTQSSVRTSSLSEKRSLAVAQATENQLIISTIFWNAQLSFCEYSHGNKTVSFQSLWAKESKLRSLVCDGMEDLGLRSALWELCHLVLAAGPASMLKVLLDESILRKYRFCRFDTIYPMYSESSVIILVPLVVVKKIGLKNSVVSLLSWHIEYLVNNEVVLVSWCSQTLLLYPHKMSF